MKRGILLNTRISSVVSAMGHTDSLTIGDAGLPIPESVERIDLAVKAGLPSFIEVLKTVLEELCIERIMLAEEIRTINPDGFHKISELLREYKETTGYTIKMEFVPHEDLKKETAKSKAVIRTGETQSYANIILYSGVVF